MQETEKNYFDFLEKIDEALYKEDQIPLFSGFYPLDLSSFSSTLERALDMTPLSLALGEQKWRNREELFAGFSKDRRSISLLLTPFSHPCFLLLDKSDEKKLTSFSLPVKGLQTEKLQEGFFDFFLLQALQAIEETGFLKELSPKICQHPLPDQAFCIDVKIQKEKVHLLTRIVLTTLFRKEWNHHFSSRAPMQIPASLSEKTVISLSFRLGSVQLTPEVLSTVKKGDFIALDAIYFDPKEHKGSLRVYLNTICLFRAKISENRVKLLEYSHYHEEPAMQEENLPENEPLQEVEEKAQSIQDIPLEICIELAKVSISLSKLKQLQPGNYLSLPITAEHGVNLTINNSCIGKGELIYLGDRLGVRVLELGKKKS